MTPPPRVPLATMYSQFDEMARGRDKHGDSSAAHAAIVDRLASNRRAAEAAGWTSLLLERNGGVGRLRLVGLPPHGAQPAVVPDSSSIAGDGG